MVNENKYFQKAPYHFNQFTIMICDSYFEQSEKEVMDLRQRTREGIQTAKLNGKIPCRKHGAQITTKKSIAAKEVIQKYAKDFGGSLPDTDVMILTGLARNTYYKYKRELKAALEEA